MSTFQWLSASAAWLALALGIFNAVRDVLKTRVRLVVDVLPGGAAAHAIQVVNRSAFDVVIEDVGFIKKGGEKVPLRMQNADGSASDGKPHPLKQREAMRAPLDMRDTLMVSFRHYEFAYARTQCGHTKRVRFDPTPFQPDVVKPR